MGKGNPPATAVLSGAPPSAPTSPEAGPSDTLALTGAGAAAGAAAAHSPSAIANPVLKSQHCGLAAHQLAKSLSKVVKATPLVMVRVPHP